MRHFSDRRCVSLFSRYLLDLSKEQEVAFASKLRDIAAGAGFEPCHKVKSDDAHAIFMRRKE